MPQRMAADSYDPFKPTFYDRPTFRVYFRYRVGRGRVEAREEIVEAGSQEAASGTVRDRYPGAIIRWVEPLPWKGDVTELTDKMPEMPTPQPIWTKRNLEEWAKAILGENAIVFQNGQQICAEAATPGPNGYQVKRRFLQLDGDALVWKDYSMPLRLGQDMVALLRELPGQQIGGGTSGR